MRLKIFGSISEYCEDLVAYPRRYDFRHILAKQRSVSDVGIVIMLLDLTDTKSILGRIFDGQRMVKLMVSLNSGQGPGGTTNPLIGMKNLGDYILDAGWTVLAGFSKRSGHSS